jgi:hypothetical protein
MFDGRLQEIEEKIGKVFQNILDLTLHRGRKRRRSIRAVKSLVKEYLKSIVVLSFQQSSCGINRPALHSNVHRLMVLWVRGVFLFAWICISVTVRSLQTIECDRLYSQKFDIFIVQTLSEDLRCFAILNQLGQVKFDQLFCSAKIKSGYFLGPGQ